MIIRLGGKKKMFTHNFANLLGSYERRALLVFALNNNNLILRTKLSNEYQNHGLPRMSDSSSILYSIPNKKNG